MPRDICPASHACPYTLTHAAFPTTWHGYPDSLQHRFTPSATHACTHTHTPPPPTPARTPELEMVQSLPAAALPTTTPPTSSRAGFFQPEPRSLYCKLWKLVSDAAASACYLFPLFFPPRRPSGQESRSWDTAGSAEAGSTEGRTTQEPLVRSKGAMSIRPEAPREEGDAGDRGREAELRGRARLSQQRRLRQATQFLHKDSADLLPLDGLKRLGTSKDWVRLPSPLPSPGGAETPTFSGSAGRVKTLSLQTLACPWGGGRRL